MKRAVKRSAGNWLALIAGLCIGCVLLAIGWVILQGITLIPTGLYWTVVLTWDAGNWMVDNLNFQYTIFCVVGFFMLASVALQIVVDEGY